MAKIICITGATSGIGRACAVKFAQDNHQLILIGRRTERLTALKADLESSTESKVHTVTLDVRDRSAVKQAFENLPESIKRIDVLINNAGLAAGRNSIDEGDVDDWDRMIDTNVKGLLYVSKSVMPGMVDRQSGHIFNIGSTAGKETYLNGNVYCASKHAVDSLTKAMRTDLLPHGIKVTGICPGLAETEFSIVRYHGDEDKAKSVYDGFTPLYGEDIAEIIHFASERPAHVCMNDIVITPTAQASSFYVNKS